MLNAVEFIAEPTAKRITIDYIDGQWEAIIKVAGDTYIGYAENGHLALLAAMQRYRDTDPDLPGVQTLTIAIDRDSDGSAR